MNRRVLFVLVATVCALTACKKGTPEDPKTAIETEVRGPASKPASELAWVPSQTQVLMRVEIDALKTIYPWIGAKPEDDPIRDITGGSRQTTRRSTRRARSSSPSPRQGAPSSPGHCRSAPRSTSPARPSSRPSTTA